MSVAELKCEMYKAREKSIEALRERVAWLIIRWVAPVLFVLS